MRELELMPGVVEWTKEHGIRIPYRVLGVIPRTYLPDFLVSFADGSKELHETKGTGFLFWLETHAKRRAADGWCRDRAMRYRFIEKTGGALFAHNNALARTENPISRQRPPGAASLDDLMR